MIKNIIFDMGNVLLEYTPKRYVKTVTDDEIIATALIKELFSGDEWQELDKGIITEEDLVMRVSDRIPQYTEYVKKAMDNWHSDLTPIEGMEEIVKKLKDKGYKIYLLSNTSLRFFKYRDNVKIFSHFDGFIVSAEEKLLKPDKAIYDCICQRFNLNCNECIFIDDLKDNIEGALNAGLKAHLFTGANELFNYLQEQKVL